MTIREAINTLKNSNEYHHAHGDYPHSQKSLEAFDMAIQCLEAFDNKFEVGDEVVTKTCDFYKGVIVRVEEGVFGCISVLYPHGGVVQHDRLSCKKTGEHYSQIVEVFERLKKED